MTRWLLCALGLGCAVALHAPAADAVVLPPQYSESVVLAGLDNPTAVKFSPDGRVFVAEKNGRILVYSSLEDTTPTVFADLSTQVYNFWDRGLLGLALDPGFPATPYVYVLYTHDPVVDGEPRWGTPGILSDPCPTPPGPTTDGCVASGRLSRLQADGDHMTGSENVLIQDWCQQYPSHSVGDLAFGPDGALYVSGGEGASFTFADYGQRGTPQKNPCGDPPTGVGGNQVPPTAEGGALRSQDLRTRSDPVGLNGTILRLDPATGAAMPGNPLGLDADLNARRIVAHGFRNPFRFAFRPGTSELWIGDVGSDTSEEIDRLESPAAAPVENFGWPCYEGGGGQWMYSALGLDLCTQLYGNDTTTYPFFKYPHDGHVFAGDPCPAGGASTSGLAFGGDSFPGYAGALFFADYTRNCIWVMKAGPDGAPDPDQVETFAAGASGPVDLELGPEGALFYPDLNGGTIRRIRYRIPVAVAAANPRSGPAPLEVHFDGTGSTDDDGDPLSYAWDLDGDGEFDDSTAPTPAFTYTEHGVYTARLRVSDPADNSSVDTVTITVDDAPPVAAIVAPGSGTAWKVGDPISFSGTGTDVEDGPLGPDAFAWSLVLKHCPSSCHSHPVEDFAGVKSGSFVAPDHEYPSHLELTLTVTDSNGLSDTDTISLDPQTVPLRFETIPSGLRLVVGSTTAFAPFTRVVIVGSLNSVSAPSPQSVGPTPFTFSTWSDGGPQSHELTAPATPSAVTAVFGAPPPAPPPPPAASPPASQPLPQAAIVRCVVPKLTGRAMRAAKRAIAAAHCTVGRIARAYSRRVKRGSVVSQNPRPRTKLARGSKVRFVVSRGRRR